MSRRLVHFFLSFMLLGPLIAAAQGIPLDPIRVRVTPEVPGPQSPVRIELQDATASLRDAVITWYLNGAVALSGAAQRSFSFTTGALGKTTLVSVRIETGGAVIEREFTFRPGFVRLTFEADTYTPPFFRGKALLSPGAGARVFAFTDIRSAGGGRIPESSLLFEWERNGTKFADRSGLGVSSFSFTGNQLSEGEEIAVNVLSSDGTRVGRGSLFVPAVDPLIRFYERDPLRGIVYENALTSAAFAGEEITVVAEPYFFSGAARGSASLVYEWKLDGEPVAPGNASGILTFRNERGGSGEALVAVSVQHKARTRLLQAAEAALPLLFGEEVPAF